jgi:hypothetical protein
MIDDDGVIRHYYVAHWKKKIGLIHHYYVAHWK